MRPPPPRDASSRPFLQLQQRAERVGDVALQRNAGPDVLQAVPVQRAHERCRGQFLVPVLLHVQVHELRYRYSIRTDEPRAIRGAEQALQPVAQHADRVLASQRRDLRVNRGDLDRDHLGLGPLQSLQVLLQAALGLCFAQDRLAEEVDVHPHTFGAALGEMLREHFLLARQDDVGRLLLHVLLDQWQRDAGHECAERLEAFHQRAVDGPEEARHALHVEYVGEMLDRSRRIAGAKGLVGHQRERRLVGRRLQHAVELGLLASLRRCLQRAGPRLQAARHEQRLLNRRRMGRARNGLEAAEQAVEEVGIWHVGSLQVARLRAKGRSIDLSSANRTRGDT